MAYKINYPINVGIIMDGNRRWAESRGLPPIIGHQKGARVVKKIIKQAVIRNVNQLTFFAFSTENWSRSDSEINALFSLFEWYIKSNISELKKNNVIFKVIGDKTQLSLSLKDLIEKSEDLTKDNSGLSLNVAINYGGKIDILHAVKSICSEVNSDKIEIKDVSENTIQKHLLSSYIEDIDLLIRTSGERRVSNFLLWQIAYSEIYFSNTMWPDYSEKDFDLALNDYKLRERRYGSSLVV